MADKIKVLVGSKNPVKIQCTLQAFQKVFSNHSIEVNGVSVPSGVSDQPMTDLETLLGAENRAKALQSSYEADYFVGIEGGLETVDEDMEAFAWIYIQGPGKQGKARTATFQLPKKIQSLINQGIELGVADDMVFKRENSKQGNGAVGILTHDLINRADYYEPAVVLALIPFVNPDLY